MRSPFPEKFPRWLGPTLALMFVVSWIPLGMVAMYRSEASTLPRVSIVPDMDKQEKYRGQLVNEMFADQRASRMPVAGTVPYAAAQTDDHYYRGIVDGSWVTELPVEVNMELLTRGQERFNIYCAPCHGISGYGNGMIAVRADELLEGTWVAPSSLHDELVRSRPVGHIYNSISNGIRNMPPYGHQVPVNDRWAIVAYVKALQRSQGAAPAAVVSRQLPSSDEAGSPTPESTNEATSQTGAAEAAE